MKQSKANSSKLYQPYFNHHYNTNRNRNQWPIQKLGDNRKLRYVQFPGRPVLPAPDERHSTLGSIGEFGSLGELENRYDHEVYYDEDQGPLHRYQ